MGRLTPEELRRRRANAQLLQPASRSPADIVRRQLAVQAQDMRQARVALWARSTSMTRAKIDRAFADREIVLAWFNRGTLHLVAAEDYGWLLSLTAPTQTTSNRRRLAQLGVPDPERGARAIERALADGPLVRGELRAAVSGTVTGEAFLHNLGYTALAGRVLRCHDDTWALTADWLGPQKPVDRDKAVRELGRRYLRTRAPAAPADLAWWAGLPLRDARAALEGAREPRGSAEPVPPRLLPAWDEYLLGWKDRSFHVRGGDVDKIYRGGLIGPVATVDGLSVGKWRARKGEQPVLEPFGRLTKEQRAGLEAEAGALAAYLA